MGGAGSAHTHVEDSQTGSYVKMGLLSGIGKFLGGALGGFGILQGGSGMGKAAKSLAADTGRTMAALREDVRQIKELLIKEVWPRVNDTLDDVQAVLKETQTFVTTGTFTVKVLALLLIVCVLYILRKQITSVQWHRNAYRHSQAQAVGGGHSGELVRALEGVFLQFLFWACLLMTLVLVLHLVHEILHITQINSFWPANIPLIIIIPSFATAAVILQYLTDIVHGITSAILLLLYCLFGYPLVLVVNPASKGSCYAQTSTLLSFVVLLTTILLYVVVATFPLLYLWEVFQLNQPVVEFVLLAYLVFFATAIVINADSFNASL